MTLDISVDTRFTAIGMSQPALRQTVPSQPVWAVSRESTWPWLAVAFAAYWAIFVAGAFTNQQSLNNVGAVFIPGAVMAYGIGLVRYCGLILAIYSFSENNLDNFPFMSPFILCLPSSGESETGPRSAVRGTNR